MKNAGSPAHPVSLLDDRERHLPAGGLWSEDQPSRPRRLGVEAYQHAVPWPKWVARLDSREVVANAPVAVTVHQSKARLRAIDTGNSVGRIDLARTTSRDQRGNCQDADPCFHGQMMPERCAV